MSDCPRDFARRYTTLIFLFGFEKNKNILKLLKSADLTLHWKPYCIGARDSEMVNYGVAMVSDHDSKIHN